MKRAFFFLGIVSFFIFTANLFAVDIKMVGMYTSPANPCATPGQSITIQGVMKSVGGPSDNVVIAYGIGNQEKHRQTIPHLDADVDMEVDYYYPEPTSGIYTFWFKLDPDQTSMDSNRNNNNVSKTLDLSGCPPAKPDLSPNKLKIEPAEYKKDNDVTIKYSVVNWHSIPSVPSEMRLLVNDQLVQTCQVPALGKLSIHECQYPWKVVCGATLKMLVDSSNTNDEESENNNMFSIKAKCKLIAMPHDLVVSTTVKK
jgi:subtilase family serine protease